MLISQQGIHIELNRKRQYIQIGNSPLDCHRFTIEIHWHHCEWLTYVSDYNQILPGVKNINNKLFEQ